MQTHQILSGLLAAATILVSSASQADDLPADTNGRFTQARSRTFRTFDTRTQQTWQGPYFFLQLADTQYGMFTGNKGFEKEVAL